VNLVDLRELARPVGNIMQRSARGVAGTARKDLERAIARDLQKRYVASANAFSKDLGGPGFPKLDAAWKRRELNRKAKTMAESLNKTFAKERVRIRGLPTKTERARATSALSRRKKQQLDRLLQQEADFQAQTDMLAHSGVVGVDKGRVMNFENLGPDTCPICEMISSGNPYTIQSATTLGAAAHPNCQCAWAEQWGVDDALKQNIRRQVQDGEVRLWDGSSRTPARGLASTKAAKMQVRKGGWKGRRTQQRSLDTRLTRKARQAHRRLPPAGF